MKKYYFRLGDTKLQSICIKKLGLGIRLISTTEIEEITEKMFENILTKRNKRIINIGRKILVDHEADVLNNSQDRKLFDEMNTFLDKIDENHQKSFFMLMSEKNQNFDKRNFKKSISDLYVLEVDEDIFKRYYNIEQVQHMILSLLKFSYYIDSKILDFNEIGSNYNCYDLDIIDFNNIKKIIFIFDLSDNYVSYNYDNMQKICELMNKKDIYFNMSFISGIDELFYNEKSIENNIINKIAFIERLIIGEHEEKEKQFILKIGMICFGKTFKDNLSEILKNIYEIRSLIVHGNEKKLHEKMDYYAKCFEIKDLKKNKYENRFSLLITVSIYLDIVFKEFMNTYIYENDLCEFIKNN